MIKNLLIICYLQKDFYAHMPMGIGNGWLN